MISFYYVNQVTKEHVRGDKNPPVGVWNRVQADADGWIEWRGDGECPLPDGCPVDVKHRGGFVNYGAYASSDPTEDGIISIKMDGDVARTKATKWRWKGSLGDILAYRLILDANPEPHAWNGEGLPPVGVECEAYVVNRGTWTKVKIRAHDGDVAIFKNGTGHLYAGGTADSFRPIRSAEDKAVEEMARIIADGHDVYIGAHEAAQRLCRAGYRKTATTDGEDT